MESKQIICELLLPAIRATQHNDSLVSLMYETHEHHKATVTAFFSSGFARKIDVSYCTGIEMIRDIVKTFVG